MKAKLIKGNTPFEIKNALAESLTDGFKPTLAIVFLSFKQDIDAVCRILDNEGIQIFGATSSGEFISSEIEEGSIAIMLLDMNAAYFKLMFLEAGDSSDFEIAKQIGKEGKKIFSNPAFILASGWSNEIDGEEIIKGIEDGFGEGATIFGGMAGDDLTLSGPKAFTLGKSSITGLVALIIDEDKVDISGVATCGWKPIGITKTITKSTGNVPQGAKVRFSLPPDFDVIDTVESECKELKDEQAQDADAVIMFSCISRYLSLGVMTSKEIDRVIKIWNAPMIGFFSYGEYGKSKRGKHEFHNNTCCVVVLKEK